jgi:pimeloyl-ACP methyl ester carboxylesterase
MTTGGWTAEEIGGHPVDWWRPSGTVRGVVVYLHGYDNVPLRDQPVYPPLLDAQQLACVAPNGPGCWWTTTLDPEFDPIHSPLAFVCQTLVEAIRVRFPEVTAPLGIFGVEMGGQGALQAAYRSPRLFPNVAAISPKVDFETWHGHGTSLDRLFPDREAARQQIATLQLNPLNWPKRQLLVCDPHDHYVWDGVATLASKLTSSGVPFEQDFTTTHGGFGPRYATAMAPKVIQFLAAGIV